MKLTAKVNRIVNEHLDGEISGGWRSVWKVLAEEIERVTAQDDDTLKLVRQNRLHEALSDDQWLVAKFSMCSPLDPLNAISDGICRRLWKDSNVELALRLSFSARHHWVASHFAGALDELWRPMLMALAAHDHLALNRLIELWQRSNEKPSSRSYAQICDALQAIVTGDRDLLCQTVGTFAKGNRPAYVSSVREVICSIANRDAGRFAEGMNRMLRSYRSYMFGDDVMGLIDPHAVGLYELAHKRIPEVTASFDVQQKLPWDREYFQWLQNCDDIQDCFEPFDAPDWMRHSIFEMDGLEWALSVRAKR
ncbi:hypothetical protein [Rhodopirellula sp. MGV]|uniref:hypothetical protein n=1 Tax=Rhodopirellula sp. MGV TaxID=2023130 RepID=UPI000B978E66|nr:hypothetical protein [Rhodopirellula sp. MGV]OYP35200.1 hypothetical protein CGZ80_12440 [Rhodopirellula sp. MGV]PNY37786.1 hypothetical protein C2E31_05860 [Rhodopirellula baltica]